MQAMTSEIEQRNKQIKKKLIDLDMNQKTLAALIGIAPAYLNDVLSGRKSGKKYEAQIMQILSDEENRRKVKKISG